MRTNQGKAVRERMEMLAIAVTLLVSAVPAFAGKSGGVENLPMPGPAPRRVTDERKVTNERKAKMEIEALFKAQEEAHAKTDVTAGAALIDFPILMVTDDAKSVTSALWDKERWTQAMTPFFNPIPNPPSIKRNVTVLTDSLATVVTDWTLVTGESKISGRSESLLVKRDGRWLVKSEVEGGWGDVLKEAASQGTPPGTVRP